MLFNILFLFVQLFLLSSSSPVNPIPVLLEAEQAALSKSTTKGFGSLITEKAAAIGQSLKETATNIGDFASLLRKPKLPPPVQIKGNDPVALLRKGGQQIKQAAIKATQAIANNMKTKILEDNAAFLIETKFRWLPQSWRPRFKKWIQDFQNWMWYATCRAKVHPNIKLRNWAEALQAKMVTLNKDVKSSDQSRIVDMICQTHHLPVGVRI